MLPCSMLRRKKTVLLAALVLGLVAALWFQWLGRVRWMDRDEGMYAMAAELVRQGQVPWKDFLYPQSPLYPSILAWFRGDMACLRSISGACGGLAVGILACFWGYRRSVTTAVWGCLVLMSCSYVAGWIPTVKTQAPATLLTVTAAVLVAQRASADRYKISLAVAAGVFAGLATLVKIPCFVLVIPSLAWLVMTERRRIIGVRDAAVFLVVTLAIVAAGFASTGASRYQILFNLIDYHNHPLEHGWGPRLSVLEFWIKDTHALLLLAFGVAGGIYLGRSRGPLHQRDHLFALMIALLLSAGYLLASMPQKQYLSFAAPFWVWAATPLWHRFSVRRPLPSWQTLLSMAAWVGLSLLAYWPEMTVTPFVRQDCFETGQVREVRDYLRDNLPAGSEVAAIWPGYVVDTGHRPTPGLESGFSFKVADRLTPQQQQDLHVLGWPELLDRIRAGKPDALVFSREDVGRFKVRPELFERFYTLRFRTKSVLVFVRS